MPRNSSSPPPRDSQLAERIRAFVHAALEDFTIAERTATVLTALPCDVTCGFLDDPAFHLALEDYQPGRGTQVLLVCPAVGIWRGSRTVVLRKRLATAELAFASWVIAHEFAHAHLWGGGWGEIADPEDAADALAAHWGFPRP